jgi:hypothetical protein
VTLPSQTGFSVEDRAYERGVIFGRQAIIKQIREALNEGANAEAIDQLLTGLANVDFTRI